MKKSKLILCLIAVLTLSSNAFAGGIPVFDAANNALATLKKAMDAAFQATQNMNMDTVIRFVEKEFAEQVKIYDECVSLYRQAVTTYDWIDSNVGDAKRLKTFLSCCFATPANIQELRMLVNSTLTQAQIVTNRGYQLALLCCADDIMNSDVTKNSADRGIDRQKHAQAARKVADQCDKMAQDMLTTLQNKDQALEAKVSSGTADIMQITHATAQGTMFVAEELARVNANISAINRAQARQEEALGESEMNRAQEAAAYTKMEKQAIDQGNSYTRQQDSRTRISNVFKNCRAF